MLNDIIELLEKVTTNPAKLIPTIIFISIAIICFKAFKNTFSTFFSLLNHEMKLRFIVSAALLLLGVACSTLAYVIFKLC